MDGILPTKLYCTNKDVDEENAGFLHELPTSVVSFSASDTFRGNIDGAQQKRLLELIDKKCPASLALKIGAQVMLLKNMHERRLVNGSRGVVTGFANMRCHGHGLAAGVYNCPVVRFDTGQQLAIEPISFFQGGPGGTVVRVAVPLKLAWALTVHKSQGMSLTRAELMLADAFDFGQVYVALSRVTSLAGLWVRGAGIDQGVVKAHPAVLAFYRTIGC